jgi:hypothetical protein
VAVNGWPPRHWIVTSLSTPRKFRADQNKYAGEFGNCVDMPGDLPVPGEVIIYNGCICGVPSGGGGRDFGWALAASAALAARWRRRARRFE